MTIPERFAAAIADRSPTSPCDTIRLRFAFDECIPGQIGDARLVIASRCDVDPDRPIDAIYEIEEQ